MCKQFFKTQSTMNYIKRLLLLIVLLCSVSALYAKGIQTAKELVAFAKAANKGEDLTEWRNEKGVICLENDIDMTKVKKWTPIKEFKGTFDGQGFALVNWKTKAGLFDLIADGGIVRNLRIDGSCSMNVSTKGDVIAGFIARVNKGIIQNCENNAHIKFKAAYTEQHIYIGGLVGQNGYVIKDCRNNGFISTDVEIVSANKGLSVSVGGIAGATIPKGSRIISIFRCENNAPIVHRSDAPRNYIAGIVGYSGRAGVRYCVNKGHITGTGLDGLAGARFYFNIAGVVAQTTQHVQCCDNFGTITVNGTHSSYAGGICSSLNRAMNLIGCSNYGNVFSSCTYSACLGGILGASGDGARLCNCTNYGQVILNSPMCTGGSFVGGIAGYIFSKKNTKFGSRLRTCTNFGHAENKATGKDVYVGGVTGRARGSKTAEITFVDCANKGTVKNVSDLIGDLSAKPAYTSVKGDFFHNNMAKAVSKPLEDKYTVYGRVTTTTGEPVVGAVISDGEFCVTTNEFGEYKIKSNLSYARFITISTPADYKLVFRNSVPQNFFRIPRHAAAVTADFVLEKREAPVTKYSVVMIGDPQMKGFGVSEAGNKLRNNIYPDIVALRASKAEQENEFFAINLGDLVFNDMAKLDDYLDVISDSNIPMFHAIGNHDYDQTTFLETKLGTMHFEEFLTPTYYSFNVGKIHYVIVNDISFSRKIPKQKYRLGLEYWHYKWLERDLQFVPKDHTIVICGHAQLFRQFNKKDPDGKKNLSYARYSKLLSQYARVYSWSGHYHYNFGYDYANSTNEAHEPLKNITSICVARATGGLHCNRDLYNDGTPNGYMVVEVDGDKVEWYYKSIGKDRDYQMHVYAPTRTGGELVKVNIWNWSKDHWSTPEWWENGKKVGEMTHKFEKDVAFVEDHKEKGPYTLGKSKDDKARPYNAHGMFHIKPSEGVYSGEVRVTDNFGRTYIQKVAW